MCVYISLEHPLEDRRRGRGRSSWRRRRPENASWCAIFTNFRLKYFGQVALAAAQACVRTLTHTFSSLQTQIHTHIYIYI